MSAPADLLAALAARRAMAQPLAACRLCGAGIRHDGAAWTTGRPGGVGCPTTSGEVYGHLPVQADRAKASDAAAVLTAYAGALALTLDLDDGLDPGAAYAATVTACEHAERRTIPGSFPVALPSGVVGVAYLDDGPARSQGGPQ